jgi:hypothetical protein
MSEYTPGDKVIVRAGWFLRHPGSPLRGTQTVCHPGKHIKPGEVAIEHHGHVYYVPERFVRGAEKP